MQINPIAEALKGVRLIDRVLPSTKATPKPAKHIVVGDPTRTPINRQAALLISPMRSWLSQPLPPERLPNPLQGELNALQAQLKMERNHRALLAEEVGQLRHQLRELKAIIEGLDAERSRLKSIISERDNMIQQLEDIRL